LADHLQDVWFVVSDQYLKWSSHGNVTAERSAWQRWMAELSEYDGIRGNPAS
jgi:hypothetical protein